MKRYLFFTLCVTCCIASATTVGAVEPQAAVGTQPSTTVSNVVVTADVVPGEPAVMVHITNMAKVPLESWELRVTYDTGSGSPTTFERTTDTSFNERPLDTPGQGPIQPGDTRDVQLRLPVAPVSATAEVRMALFADLSSQGDPEVVDRILKQREREARLFDAWISVLNAASGKPPAEAKGILKKALIENQQRTADSVLAGVTAERIAALINSDDTELEGPRGISALKQVFEHQRDQARRRKSQ